TASEQITLGSLRRDLLGAGPVPKHVAELMVCDASLRRLVVDTNGQPLNLGWATPEVTGSQRHALHLRDQGCVFPTCIRPAHWCDAHHVHPRSLGGPTDLGNLVLLCRHHHRLVHGPEWELQRDPINAVVVVTWADGVTYRRDEFGVVDPLHPYSPDRSPPTD
ncbi:MAG: HNH endonuclease signature motif containing protein, partial [Actinomycetota bacterium]|nr:HNH endonuclease signature motif containing protein [Actinomycetota bacterium]